MCFFGVLIVSGCIHWSEFREPCPDYSCQSSRVLSEICGQCFVFWTQNPPWKYWKNVRDTNLWLLTNWNYCWTQNPYIKPWELIIKPKHAELKTVNLWQLDLVLWLMATLRDLWCQLSTNCSQCSPVIGLKLALFSGPNWLDVFLKLHFDPSPMQTSLHAPNSRSKNKGRLKKVNSTEKV